VVRRLGFAVALGVSAFCTGFLYACILSGKALREGKLDDLRDQMRREDNISYFRERL
jgi:hypothetical protein